MSENLPPTIDPVAAARWQQAAPAQSPWLHEEVGRRMEDRLQWICRTPKTWCDWQPVRGGLQVHEMIAQRYPQAQCHVVETAARMQAVAQQRFARPWWSPARWGGVKTSVEMPAPASVEMLWANMLLHTQAQPMQMLKAWHEVLAVDGFVMFSCLGPDTVKEMRALYERMGWPAAGHSFTDMHDWGDMLVQAGFAEPVMDMETITLTFATPQRLLQELRELGCNLHPQRFPALRGRAWLEQLQAAIGEYLRVDGSEGQLALTFELVYGHAFKPQPRVAVDSESTVSLEQMRSMLKKRSEQGLR
ncbi:MAG: class I SAM-dependent methyltransferase [Comamonadaceae bacterium]|nr:class I SAM-dependent methyltransferase [Comamonadaceae bacterium]